MGQTTPVPARRPAAPQRRLTHGHNIAIGLAAVNASADELSAGLYMSVGARRGFAFIGPDEAAWTIAWHFSNHLTNAFCGDLMVTDHGWIDFMTGCGGRQPSLS